jgi:sodium-dependent dicarboxylate transporter 2/3/5
MWITDMAVAALLTPLGASILSSAHITPPKSRGGEKPKPRSNFGRALMISCCWGAVFGGIGTPAGCGPNPIAIEYLKRLSDIHISFLDWMKIGVPTSFILVPVGWLVLVLLFPPEMKSLPIKREEIKRQLNDKGPLTRGELTTLIVFLSVIALWVGGDLITKLTGGAVILSMELVSLLGGLVFFLPKIKLFEWSEAEPLMNWGAIVLVMASLALGLMMYETGAARWLAWVLLGKIQMFSPLVKIALVIGAVLFMKLFLASNTVTGIIVIPLLITLAGDLGIDPWFLVAPAAFTSSLGVILLTQSPTNIIPFTPGYFTVRDFFLSGIVLTIVMIGVLTGAIAILGPLTGIYTF